MKKIWISLFLFLIVCAVFLHFFQGRLTSDLSLLGLSGQVFLEEDFIHPHKVDRENFGARDAIEVVKEETQAMDFYRDYHLNMKSVADYKWFAVVENKKEENYFLVTMRETKIESPFLCKARVDSKKHSVIESVCGHEQEGRPLLFPSEYSESFQH